MISSWLGGAYKFNDLLLGFLWRITCSGKSDNMKIIKMLALAGLPFLSLDGSTPVLAVSYTFVNIQQEVSNDYASQLSLEVTDVSSDDVDKVLFTFKNSGPLPGRIKGISIQDLDDLLFSDPTLVNTPPQVMFSSKGGANIPASIPFQPEFDFKVSGAAARGVDPGESLGILFRGNYTTVLESIDARKIEFGLHVGSMPRDESQKFLNSGPVLLPDGGLTLALLSLAYLGIGALRKSFP